MSKVSKHLIGIAAVALVAVAPTSLRRALVQQRLYAAAKPVQPFTIQQHDEVKETNVGYAANIEVRTIAVRGDGSRVQVIREPGKGWVSREIRFITGLYQTVYDEVRVVSTVQLTTEEQLRRLNSPADPANNCLTTMDGTQAKSVNVLQGEESRFGIRVNRILQGDGFTVWKAPSLGCTTVEHYVDWKPAHPGTNTSRLLVDSIVLGEPEPNLFTVPGDYLELPPSQAVERHLRFASIPESGVQRLVDNWAKRDPYYASHRPATPQH